jgi:hypothetical protein
LREQQRPRRGEHLSGLQQAIHTIADRDAEAAGLQGALDPLQPLGTPAAEFSQHSALLSDEHVANCVALTLSGSGREAKQDALPAEGLDEPRAAGPSLPRPRRRGALACGASAARWPSHARPDRVTADPS